MNPKLEKIQETITKTRNYWKKYTNTTSQLDIQIIEYLELKKEEAEITSHNNKIEIKFKNVPTTQQITKLLYLSKTLGYKFKQHSLTSYIMTSKK